MSKKYYILSIGKIWGNQAVFWGKNNSGYTSNLNNAGIYSEQQVLENISYYDNGKETRAISVDEIEKLSYKCVNYHSSLLNINR